MPTIVPVQRPAPPDAAPTQHQVVEAHLQGVAADEDRLPVRPIQWLVLMIFSALIGAAAGAVGAIFRITLNELGTLRAQMIVWAHVHGWHGIGWVAPVALSAAGAATACFLTQWLAPQAVGSGIPRVEAVLRNHLQPASAKILPVKFIGGALAISSGLALGREGPTVQMGGTIGRLTGDWFRRFVPEPWTLIAAGASAGLAAAFNAPLAAVVFVVEELLHRFSARIFSAALVSCITGTVVLRLMMGNVSDFASPHLQVLRATVLPGYVLLGLVAGLFGVGFNISLMAALRLSDRLDRWPSGTKGALIGAAAGGMAWFLPHAVGGGEELAHAVIDNPLSWSLLIGLLLTRFLLTISSYSTGAPGGIFAPLLALGALLGSGFAAAQGAITGQTPEVAPFVIVAMAACFTSVVRSPLTGVVLLLEMTGSWPLILPMMAASITAYAIPELLGNPPIYDSLRKHDEVKEHAERRNLVSPDYSVRREKALFFSGNDTRPATGRSSR